MDTMRSARPLWRRSIILRIFLVCFVCIHLPLVALVVTLGEMPEGDDLAKLLIVLGATLVGTILCLGILWHFMTPLRRLAQEIATFRLTGEFNEDELNKRGNDELAVVTRAVCGLVGEVESLGESFEGKVMVDPLSGLASGRTMLDRGEEVFRQCRDQQSALSVIMFDLNQFREIREAHGREAADRMLIAVGDVVREELQEPAIGGIMGGGMFMLLMPNVDNDRAWNFTELLSQKLEKLAVEPFKRGELTASFGVSMLDPETMTSLADLIREADMALYQAKETGRARWRAAS